MFAKGHAYTTPVMVIYISRVMDRWVALVYFTNHDDSCACPSCLMPARTHATNRMMLPSKYLVSDWCWATAGYRPGAISTTNVQGSIKHTMAGPALAPLPIHLANDDQDSTQL